MKSNQFIPPQSSVSKVLNAIPLLWPEGLDFDQVEWKLVRSDNYRFKFKKLQYDPDSSPIHFRNYMSFVSEKGGEFHIDHQFFASEIWWVHTEDNFHPDSLKNRADIYPL